MVREKVVISRKKFLLFILVCTVSVISAFVIGYAVRHSRKCDETEASTSSILKTDFERKKFYDDLAKTIDPQNIKRNLRYFAKYPHHASSNGTERIARKLHSMFESYNFKAEYHEYLPLLSFPDETKPNYAKVVSQNGTEIHVLRRIEKILEPSEETSEALPFYYAYGKNANLKGDLIYANHGSKDDFKYLTMQNVSLNGSIILVRDHEVGVGTQIRNALEHGVIAILLFFDPKYYAPGKKYPKGRWMSDDSVIRGSAIVGGPDTANGDPLSGGYPAKDWAYQPDSEKFKTIDLPVQPIAAFDAEILLNLMVGSRVPQDWNAGIDVPSFRTGPLQNKSQLVLKINNKFERKKIRNVCGTIYGLKEPDRYVLLGNHIDAWVFGGVDASSGTSVMMEIARVLGEQLKKGWKPRRSIRMCGWDGEEFHLIGSVEYVEEFFSDLYDQAIAYINIDCAVAGNYSMKTAASPLLHDMIFQIYKSVKDPIADELSMFQKSKLAYPDKKDPDNHRIFEMNADSDYFAFYKFVGIPSIDIEYLQVDFDKKYNNTFYPVYHTLHDTVHWLETFVDKDYKVHSSVAEAGLKFLLYLSDLPIIPYNGVRYGDGMVDNVKQLISIFNGTNITGKETDHFAASAQKFQRNMKVLQNCSKNVKRENDLQVRIFNDKMMQLEKKLIYSTGVPGSPQIKHYIMGLSDDSETRYPFPAISNLLPKINDSIVQKKLLKQISITSSLIDSAGRIPCD